MLQNPDKKVKTDASIDSSKFDLDISMWPENNVSEFVDYWVKKGSSKIQCNNSDLFNCKSFIQKDTNRYRKCTSSMFEKNIKNEDLIKRTWLCFSPVSGKLYCFHCKLFNSKQSQFTREGYCNWKNAHHRLKKHEKSQFHLDAVYAFTIRATSLDLIRDDLKKHLSNKTFRVCNLFKMHTLIYLKKLININLLIVVHFMIT